jgi:hypothetical protein
MTNSTISVNGGAMSNVNRTVIMSRAWAIFRQTYCYPRIKFSSTGVSASNACIRQAWAEAKSTVRIAAIWAESKADRIATLTNGIAFEGFNDHWPSARASIAAMRNCPDKGKAANHRVNAGRACLRH